MKANFTFARSKMFTPTGSSATRSTPGWKPHSRWLPCAMRSACTHQRALSCIRIAVLKFRSKTFVRMLSNNNLIGSMGRVGACGDNAAMESFFALLQKNVLDRQRYTTREELRLSDHHLDRTHLPLQTTPTPTSSPHPDRVWNTTSGPSSRTKTTNHWVNKTFSSSVWVEV